MSDQKQQLETQLWNIANTLRGKMDADDFRDYILGFIFYKYLSSKMEFYANEILAPDSLAYHELKGHAQELEYLVAVKEAALEKLGYFLKPDELFSILAKRGNAGGKEEFILDDLGKVLRSIEQSTMGTASEEDFGNLFEDLDLKSSKLGKSEEDKSKLIVKVLSHLDEIDFELQNTESDILGDAYEYLIGQFASGAGKKAGEFYTPQQVSSVLAQLVTVGKERLKSVYDPNCGSGSLNFSLAKEVNEFLAFFRKEMNLKSHLLCTFKPFSPLKRNLHYSK
ncbi:type I restriction system adenine methylase (hsdM) [Spirosomataceae bacterium TFI 002]|nr:type I restriction system adenine methylase (hsdM) [Spirosomataceae bacterium TFI 002]